MQKIMFNDRFLLTDAVLEGRKTQTRRFVPEKVFTLCWDMEGTPDNPIEIYVEDSFGEYIDIRRTSFARYKVGDVVAVAQSYSNVYAELLLDWEKHNYHLPREMSAEKFRNRFEKEKGWSNKMFVKPELMPYQVKITNVRVQRLQEITDEECLLECIEKEERTDGEYNYIFFDAKRELYVRSKTPREAYSKLIDTLSGKGTWGRNPYVFAYDFELVK